MKFEINSSTDEINREFLEGMVLRMDTSFHKYGRFRVNCRGTYEAEFVEDFRDTLADLLRVWEKQKVSGSGNCNMLLFAIKRLITYCDTKNREFLMDAANALMMEFECPQVGGAYFRPTDSHESPGTVGLSEKEAQDFAE